MGAHELHYATLPPTASKGTAHQQALQNIVRNYTRYEPEDGRMALYANLMLTGKCSRDLRGQ